jgi:putative membrane protein
MLATSMQVVAQTGRYHHDWDGGGWWVMGVMMMAFWVVLIAVVVWLVVRRPDVPGAPPANRAREILAERYARGEISTEEYHERLDALR